MRLALGLLLLGLGACRGTEVGLPAGPYVRVLGTAQDGGLPQIGCRLECCESARRDARNARYVASLLLVDPVGHRRYLFDATPDLPEQVELIRDEPPGRRLPGARPALFEGVFLTHGHIGHYLGLAWLGREAYGSRDLPLHGSPRTLAYLRNHGPWSLLFESGALRGVTLEAERAVDLGGGLSVRPLVVPHRDEFTDTLAFVVKGPNRAVLYLPDIDKWERWEVPLEEMLAQVDVAYLDGTFFGPDEVPGRDLAEIPHPFVVETLARLEGLPLSERSKVRFLHLNHTNPLHDRTSEASRRVRALGAAVARQGERVEL